MAEMDVAIVAVDRKIWSGKGTFVFTRTTAGEIGILPNHIPLVGQLVDDAMVRVEREGQDDLRIAVDGGFLSVTDAGVTILAETAEFESEIEPDVGTIVDLAHHTISAAGLSASLPPAAAGFGQKHQGPVALALAAGAA